MHKARSKPRIMFQGSNLQLLMDLSRSTLAQCMSLKPLFEALREQDIPYSLGYLFQLLVHHLIRQHVLRNYENLPGFLQALDFPLKSMPDYCTGSSGTTSTPC